MGDRLAAGAVAAVWFGVVCPRAAFGGSLGVVGCRIVSSSFFGLFSLGS